MYIYVPVFRLPKMTDVTHFPDFRKFSKRTGYIRYYLPWYALENNLNLKLCTNLIQTTTIKSLFCTGKFPFAQFFSYTCTWFSNVYRKKSLAFFMNTKVNILHNLYWMLKLLLLRMGFTFTQKIVFSKHQIKTDEPWHLLINIYLSITTKF